MTLSTTANKVSYTGDGTTVSFAIPFLFLENAHIEATLRDVAGAETTWVLNTEFTLTGAGAASGGTLSVSTSPADYTPASGEALVIRRVVPETQETDYPEGGAFPAAAHEQALDKLTMLVQQHSEEIARAPALPVSSALTDITVPEPGASEVIRWNAAGTALETISVAGLSASLDAAIAGPVAGQMLAHNGTHWVNRAGNVLNIKDFGVVGDGTTDDRASIAAAVAAAASNSLFFPAGTYLVNSALTLSAGVVYGFANGAKLKPANGVTITIDGYIDAGHWQIFDISAGGSVILGSSSTISAPFDTEFPNLNDEISVAWFGANGQNDGADDTSAFQAAVDAREYSVKLRHKEQNPKIKIPPGVYRIADVDVGLTAWIDGSGPQTLLQPYGATTTAMLKFQEGAGRLSNVYFDGRKDDGITASAVYVSSGTTVPITQFKMEDCRFTKFAGLVCDIDNVDLVAIDATRFEGGDGGMLRLDDVDEAIISLCQFEMDADDGVIEQYVEVKQSSLSFSHAIKFDSCWFEGTDSETVKRGILVNASTVILDNCRTNFDTDYASFVAHVEVGADAEFVLIRGGAFTNNASKLLNCLPGAANIVLDQVRGLGTYGNITNQSNATSLYIKNAQTGIDSYDFRGKKLAFYDRADTEVCALTDVGPEVKGQLLQSFTLFIANVSGSIQHRFATDNWNNTLGNFVGKIGNASSTFAATPTGADGSTAMASGGKIGSANTNQFSCDTETQTGSDAILLATIEGNNTDTPLHARAFFESLDINGATRVRLTFALYQESDGANFAINTATFAVGQQVRIRFLGNVA